VADQSDVETVLTTLISGVLYPNGTGSPSAVGPACRIYRGWPNPSALDADLAAGVVNVTVYPRNGVERNTSRYPRLWQTLTPPVHTLAVSVLNNVITVSGTIATPQNVVVFVGQTDIFVYAVQSNDTLTTIATAVATLIAASYAGTSNVGAVITVGSTGKALTARIASTGTSIMELKRQQKEFLIIAWTNTPAMRDTVTSLVDAQLSSNVRILLPDGTYGTLIYARSLINDAPEKELLYRRDLVYMVDYATTQSRTDYEIGAMQSQIQAATSPTGTLPVPSNAPTVNANS
jgi:hypothetical protein